MIGDKDEDQSSTSAAQEITEPRDENHLGVES